MPYGPSGTGAMGGNPMDAMMSMPGAGAASRQPGPPNANGLGSSVLSRLMQGDSPLAAQPDDEQRFIAEAVQQGAQVDQDTRQAAMDAFMAHQQEQQAWAMQAGGGEGGLSDIEGSPMLAALMGGAGSAGASALMQNPLRQQFPQVPQRNMPPTSMSM